MNALHFNFAKIERVDELRDGHDLVLEVGSDRIRILMSDDEFVNLYNKVKNTCETTGLI